MSDRKYASDYILEEHLGPDGKIVSQRVYRGKHYRFRRGEASAKTLGTKLLGAAAGVLALLVPLLLNNSSIGRTAYVLFPMAFALIPLYQLAAVGWRLRSYGSPLTRQEKDLTEGRLRAVLPWLTALLGADTLGCGWYWLRRGALEEGEIFCVLGITLACALSCRILSWGKLAETEEIPEA